MPNLHAVVATATFLNDYENCPCKAHARYIAKAVPYVETPQMRWGNVVHKACEGRLTSGKPLPPEVEFLEPICLAIEQSGKVHGEQQVAVTARWEPCKFLADDVYGRGKIDVRVQRGSHKAVLLDWKTGKRREDPTELRIHAAMLKAREPELREIVGHYIWTQDARLGEAHDLSDVGRTRLLVDGMMNHVTSSLKTGHFPPRENPLCGWCDVDTCEFWKPRKS